MTPSERLAAAQEARRHFLKTVDWGSRADEAQDIQLLQEISAAEKAYDDSVSLPYDEEEP